MELHWIISAGPFAGQHMTTRGLVDRHHLRRVVRAHHLTWVIA